MIGKQLDYYKKKTILVTGGLGYIGSAFVKRLGSIPKKIIILDRKTDIRNNKIWKRLLKNTDILFHFAAQTSSKLSNEKPALDVKVNLLPVIQIIKTCQENNFYPDIIFAGTVTQVGLTKKYPVNEELKDNPITIYDINKLAAEKYLLYYSNNLGGRAVSLRLSNVYGPGVKSGKKDRGILNFFINKGLKGESLTIYGKGIFIRDYCYIVDVVNDFLLAGTKINKCKGNYYLIGSGQGNSLLKMVKIIKKQIKNRTGKLIKIKHSPFPKNISPIEKRNFVADYSAFKKASGWKSKVFLEEGISKIIDFYLRQKNK